MPRRPLGRTGLTVTPIGLGLAALGRPGYITLGRDHDLGADRSMEALERRVLEDKRVLAELSQLRASGLVIGLSVSGPRQAEVIRRSLAVEVDGVNPFETVQATWNLMEPSAGPALSEAHEAGWGVIIKEALANGRLADRDTQAIAAVLANPWADVVLSGAVTPDQLLSTVRALHAHVTADELARLAALAEPPEKYWSERSRLQWT